MSKPLTYSDYINDAAIVEALRIPQPPPAGQSAESWPLWHAPDASSPAGSTAWSPGDPWPAGGNWRHDEVLFIRTHQAFEVWFALILHELDSILREAADLAASRGAALPRVELSQRRLDAPPHPAADFPAVTREAAAAGVPSLVERIRRLATPARHAVDTPLRLDAFAPEQLDLWTSRVLRAGMALRTTIPFFRVLGTLSPAQFLEFRGRLVPASGFGSVQFREMEMTFGLREINLTKLQPAGGDDTAAPGAPPLPPGMFRPTGRTPPGVAANCFHRTLPAAAWPRVARRYAALSLRDLIYALVNAQGVAWNDPAEMRRTVDDFAARNVRETVRDWRQAAPAAGRDSTAGVESLLSERIDELDELLSHRENIAVALLAMRGGGDPRRDALGRLLEACLQLDEALLLWRDTHIRFVETMIGTRRGTGGGGVQYLRTTTDPVRGAYLTHAFPCLWHARSLVQKA